MQTTGLRAVFAAVLLVLTGCAAPTTAPGGDASPATPDPDRDGFDDPDQDMLGWEVGYWYDESIAVNRSDGLNDSEMEAYVARGMARIEQLRQLEFDERVLVSVVSRDDYRSANAGGSAASDSEYNRWNDQVWEALFIAGESAASASVISGTTGSSILGFYSPSDGEIKTVANSPGEPTIDNATFIHELVHVAQDQRFDLTDARFQGETQDGGLTTDGIVEGDASYVERRYSERCMAGTWDCAATPDTENSGGSPNLDVLITIFQPYSDGPVYVHDLYERGGWEAVDDALRNPPASTKQTIHVTDELPRLISFVDEGMNGWAAFPDQGVEGSDTAGEASMFAMFWYRARTSGAETVRVQSILDTNSQYDTYNYDTEPSNGWVNDRLFPYRNAVGAETNYGCVWVTEWDTDDDARESHDAYLNILSAHDATQRDDGAYVIADGSFNDAFRVVRTGDRVVVANGPASADVDEVRPGLAG